MPTSFANSGTAKRIFLSVLKWWPRDWISRVTLVGVVNADTALNLPDFRAGERTFQLLSQVAGRAGRGPERGRVIIQTYSPQNYAIQAAANSDYRGFYAREIGYRRMLHNPPFSRLARLTYSHPSQERCQTGDPKNEVRSQAEADRQGLSRPDFIGPAPAFTPRLRGRFRWQLICAARIPLQR